MVVGDSCMAKMGDKDSRSKRGNLRNWQLGVKRGGVVVSAAECC